MKLLKLLAITLVVNSVSYSSSGNAIDDLVPLVIEEGVSVALEVVDSLEDTEVAAAMVSRTLKKLYWQKDAIDELVVLGNAMIKRCLREAEAADLSNPKQAYSLRSWAKTLAYDVSSNTWPGWGDSPSTIYSRERMAGLSAAELNLKLAIELKKRKDIVSVAHWMLGAHLLSGGQYERAERSFKEAQRIDLEIGNYQGAHVNRAYEAINEMARGERVDGRQAYNQAIEDLQTMGALGVPFWLNQLETAKSIFVGK